MSFKLKKTTKTFRININKSGVRYCYGTKDIGTDCMAGGKLSQPKTDLSYEKRTYSNMHNVGTRIGNQKIIDVNIDDQHSAYCDFINDIKTVRRLNDISSILIATFLLSAFPFFIITGIVGLIFKVYIHKQMPINIEYEFDENSENDFDNFTNALSMLKTNKRLWQIISSESVSDARRQAGAKCIVIKTAITLLKKLPWYLSVNIRPFGLKLSKSLLIFLPDNMLMIQGKKIAVLGYDSLHMSIKTVNFIETETVPQDAEILDYTWLKVNKDGSRDKRFRDNRKVPVCKYGKIFIISKKQNDVLAEIMCSNPSTLAKIASFFKH